VDDSVWMAGVGNSVLDRAVIILQVLGISTAAVFLYLHMAQAQLRLLRWAIRRPFHRCAACHARNSSVALWSGLQGRSPCWLCAECAFGARDFDEILRSRRQPGAQIASLVEHLGRAAAFWSVPNMGGGRRHRRRHQRQHTRRQSGAQIVSLVEHLGRAAAFWRVSTVGGGGRHRRAARRPYALASPSM
jgi:hypothetical protein